MNTTTLPYEWLKEVPTALLRLDDIPLLGFPPDFPWIEFNEKLKSTFQTENIEVKPLGLQWRSREDLFSALGQDLKTLHFQIPSLEGDIYAVFAKRDILLMMSLMIANQKEPLDIVDPDFQSGFVHFLSYECINLFNQCNFDKTLNPHLAEDNGKSDEEIKDELLSRESSLCQDISLSLEGSTFIIRLILSNEFRKSWKEKYAARTLDIPLHQELAKKIQIPVALEAGRISLKVSEWKEIGVGDFIIPDFCSLDPANEKSRIMLTVNGNRFFRARIKQGSIKLLEHPLLHEGFLSDDENQETTKQDKRKDKSMAKIPDEDLDEELEDHDGDDYTFDETDEDDETKEKTAVEEKEDSLHEATPSVVGQTAKAFQPDEINLDIVIEVGRLQMSIQKLTELVPGNILEIDVRPENGVDLVVNGKRIAKGELLKLGDVLGVRILDI